MICCVSLGVLYRANRSTIRMRFDSHEKVIELSGYGTLDVTRVCSVTVTRNEMSVRSLDRALNWASNVRETGPLCSLTHSHTRANVPPRQAEVAYVCL